jgi:cobyrinic acid a,c-diamide synthase
MKYEIRECVHRNLQPLTHFVIAGGVFGFDGMEGKSKSRIMQVPLNHSASLPYPTSTSGTTALSLVVVVEVVKVVNVSRYSSSLMGGYIGHGNEKGL